MSHPASLYGRIAELDLDIYTYDEWFLNDEGEDEAMIPDGTVLMGHSDGEGRSSMEQLPR